MLQYRHVSGYPGGCYPPSAYEVSNPDPLDYSDADVVVAPVVKAGGFRVRVPGHALRDFDPPAVGQVVLSQALAFVNNSAEFQRLTIYESRIQRSMERSLKALNELQTERRKTHADALEQAKGLARLNHLSGLPYDPATDRFEFSPEEIHAALRLSDRITHLTHYRKAGWDSAYRSRVPVPAIVELPEAA